MIRNAVKRFRMRFAAFLSFSGEKYRGKIERGKMAFLSV